MYTLVHCEEILILHREDYGFNGWNLLNFETEYLRQVHLLHLRDLTVITEHIARKMAYNAFEYRI